MAWFKSKQQKEIEKKMLIKRTINTMNKQINRLEDQKQVFIDAAKRNGQKYDGFCIIFRREDQKLFCVGSAEYCR
mgnify:CR=1 FL=1